MIKMKWNLRILTWLAVPSFFLYMMNLIVSMQYWNTNGLTSETNKNFNHEAAVYSSVIALVFTWAIIMSAIRLMRVGSDIDNLEKAKEEYETERAEMEKVKQAYTDMIDEAVLKNKPLHGETCKTQNE